MRGRKKTGNKVGRGRRRKRGKIGVVQVGGDEPG